MDPLSYYEQQCQSGALLPDPAQMRVVKEFQRLYVSLTKRPPLAWPWLKSPVSPKGLYLWGGVGAGKTLLMDDFFHCLTIEAKRRQHFYAFMQEVHAQLKRLQGRKDPLNVLAKQIAKNCRLLCFDELFVNDIADAMLLGRFFQCLFNQRVCIVATSNVAPDDLYRNGLQRDLFLPAILAMKKHMVVCPLQTQKDYRYAQTGKSSIFYVIDASTTQKMTDLFLHLNEGLAIHEGEYGLNERIVYPIKWTARSIWFAFKMLCAIPRSQNDYLVLAERFDALFLSDIPQLSEAGADVCFFIQLVDIFYDARRKLVLSSYCSLDALYPKGPYGFEFVRTRSRLEEMQTW